MVNKFFLSIPAVFLLATVSLNGASISPKKLNEVFEYDATKGWWWYKETYVDENEKEFETKVKMTPKEKMEKDDKDKVLKELKEQNAKLIVIKERLEYAFPNTTPKYTKNEKTGEKCLSNSSVDCYVHPVVAEAQHVPVMAKWLSDPNPENSKEWLKWQAKYFNHITDIGYGNKFAYMNGGEEVYSTDNVYNNGDDLNMNYSEAWQRKAIVANMNAVKDKINIFMFMGESLSVDAGSSSYYQMKGWNMPDYKDLNWYMVFKTKESLDRYENKIKLLTSKTNIESFKKFKEEGFVVVKPKYFEKFNVDFTPTTVVVYKKDKAKNQKKNDVIWAKVAIGKSGPKSITESINQFLVYNKIIDPKEMSAGATIKKFHKETKDPNYVIKIDESKMHKENFKLEVK